MYLGHGFNRVEGVTQRWAWHFTFRATQSPFMQRHGEERRNKRDNNERYSSGTTMGSITWPHLVQYRRGAYHQRPGRVPARLLARGRPAGTPPRPLLAAARPPLAPARRVGGAAILGPALLGCRRRRLLLIRWVPRNEGVLCCVQTGGAVPTGGAGLAPVTLLGATAESEGQGERPEGPGCPLSPCWEQQQSHTQPRSTRGV